MISMILFGSAITSLAILSIFAKSNVDLLYKILGYEAYVDLCFSLIIGFACGISGTMSGFVIGAATGLIFGTCLFLLKKMIGYKKYENKTWVYYPAKWPIGDLFKNMYSKYEYI